MSAFGMPGLLGFIIVCLSGCQSSAPSPSINDQAQSGIRVSFDSFTNVHYSGRQSLPGWLSTRNAIETSLKHWYSDLQVHQTVTDGSPTDLETFLSALPGSETSDISVVYLGSIQDATGRWKFVEGEERSWVEILDALAIPVHPCRIVILDACYASSVCALPAWKRKLAALTLLASAEEERAYQFSPTALFPIDVSKHCPRAWSWAQTHLPDTWRQAISFLGLMWLETVAQTSSPPMDRNTWRDFCQACTFRAKLFREEISDRWGSTLQICSSGF